MITVLASVVAMLDGSVVNVALPAIAGQFGAGLSVQQWVVDGYLITLGALMLVAGSLADIFGRKRIMMVGLVWFGTASLLCALAPTAPFLIFARIAQGIGGALLVPSSLALIMSELPVNVRSKTIGQWTSWTSISFLAGPLLGGALIQLASWRWIFIINVLPIALALYLLGKLETKERSEKVKLDLVGSILGAVGLGGIVYGLIEAPRYGFSSSTIAGSLVVGVVAMIVFYYRERSASRPLLPLGMFRIRNFSVGNLATFAIYAALSIASFVIIIFVQQVGHYSAIAAGLTMLPESILMFLLSPKFGEICRVHGPRWLMGFGPIIAGVGFLLMLLVGQTVNYFTLLPGILLFGFGLAMTVTPLTVAVLGSAGERHAGVASAVNNAVARVAGLIGVSVIGIVIGSALNLSGFKKSMIFVAILMFVGGIIYLIGITNGKKAKTTTVAGTIPKSAGI